MSEPFDYSNAPPRSTFYHLPMGGRCGASQESLLDYSQRLGISHRIAMRPLFTEVYGPLCKSGGDLRYGSLHLASVNGACQLAEDFVNLLQKLTLRTELINGTMLKWRSFLGTKLPLNKTRSWCVHCLAAQSGAEALSFSLLWSLRPVKACPLHGVALSRTCFACGHTQPRVNAENLLGRCHKCTACIYGDSQIAAAQTANAEDFFKAGCVADLINMNDAAVAMSTPENYAGAVSGLAMQTAGGSRTKFARIFGLPRNAVIPRGALNLETFLELLYRVRLSPQDFFNGTGEAASPLPAETAFTLHQKQKLDDAAVKSIDFKLKQLIESLNEGSPAVNQRKLSCELGIKVSMMRKRFPKSVARIVKHNDRVRLRLRVEREARLDSAIGATLIDLRTRGVNLSYGKIASELILQGFKWIDWYRIKAVHLQIFGPSSEDTLAITY